MRRSLLSCLALSLSVLLSAACGGGDDDGGGGGGGDTPDAAVSMPDAEVSTIQIGATCDVADATSCGDSLGCVELMDGTNPWCTTTCTMMGMADPACDAAYDGPGMAGCFLQVTPSGGGVPVNTCAVLCQAPAGCPSCDGTCPGTLTCTPNDANPGYSMCL